MKERGACRDQTTAILSHILHAAVGSTSHKRLGTLGGGGHKVRGTTTLDLSLKSAAGFGSISRSGERETITLSSEKGGERGRCTGGTYEDVKNCWVGGRNYN